jgi:tetratricopeptide (TPR) repeat protein
MFEPTPSAEDRTLQSELYTLLEQGLPASVLKRIPAQAPTEFVAIQARAWIELDQFTAAKRVLEMRISDMNGNRRLELECVWAQVVLRQGMVDRANLTAGQIANARVSDNLQAEALSILAYGYARKRCWGSADQTLRRALDLAPMNPLVLAAQGQVYLEADQRIDARNIYERMRSQPSKWSQIHGGWGLSYVAYLLGEFKSAWKTAEETLFVSPEIISPLYVMAQVAITLQDTRSLKSIITFLEKRSPEAEGAPYLQSEYEHLVNSHNVSRRRLAAFPTLIQRRNYCGPSTVELVMRYWKNGWSITNDQIAEKVKTSPSGTPLFRIREFFHLIGFDTVRTLAPAEKLKKLIDAGIPAIVQQSFPNSSHVSIVIGYDENNKTIELQDPMTHAVVHVSEAELAKSRRLYLESVILAYPKKRGYNQILAQLDLYDNPAILWTDEAVIRMDEEKFDEAASLLGQAVKRLPEHVLSWILLLHACFEIWQRAQQTEPREGVGIGLDSNNSMVATTRKKFFSNLHRAIRNHPETEFVFAFEGNAALVENNLPKALAGFEKASRINPDDAAIQASIAECLYGMRQFESAKMAALRSLELDTSLPTANAWMARALYSLGEPHATYYARAAVELAPAMWLTHLALAEALTAENSMNDALHAANKVLEYSPFNPEALCLRGEIHLSQENIADARQDLDSIFATSTSFTSCQHYRIARFLCNLLFSEGRFDGAVDQVKQFLVDFPDERWGLRFLAESYSRQFIDSVNNLSQEEFTLAVSFYEEAIRANPDERELVIDYLAFLDFIDSEETSLAVVQKLLAQYPDRSDLYFLGGRELFKAGHYENAAESMLQAIRMKGGVVDREALAEALKVILHELDPFVVDEIIHNGNQIDKDISLQELRRSLGIVLAENYPEAKSEAYQILLDVYKRNPEDAEIALHLGDVAPGDEERETYYRKALFSNVDWEQARVTFINHLLDKGRAREALDYCTGWVGRSSSMAILSGRAFYDLGFYESASQAFSQVISSMDTRHDPVDTHVLSYLWQSERKAGLHEECLATAKKGYKIFRHNPQWAMRMAVASSEMGLYDEAQLFIDRARSYGLDEVNLLRLQVNLAEKEDNLNLALEYLEAWLIDHPQIDDADSFSWEELKRFKIWLEMGEVEHAWQNFVGGDISAHKWSEAAECALNYNNLSLAMALAEQAVTKDRNHTPGLIAYGKALLLSGETEKALKIFQDIRTTHPEEHCPHEMLAVIEGLNGKFQAALELADRAVNLGARCSHAWAVRGMIYFLCRQPEEALVDLRFAWNRSSTQERQWMPEYWLLLFSLLKNHDLVNSWLEILLSLPEDHLSRKIFGLLEPLLISRKMI